MSAVIEAVRDAESILTGDAVDQDFEFLFDITASGGDPTNYC